MNPDLIVSWHHIGAIQFGKFKMKTGALAPIYLDLRVLVSHPNVLRESAHEIAQTLAPLAFDRIAAIPLAALPIGTAVALEMERPLIYPRSLKKDYGSDRRVEGEFKSGETVVLLDDLIVTGASNLEAIDTLQTARLKVRDVVVLVDREQGGVAAVTARGCIVHVIYTFRELVQTLRDAERISENQFTKVIEYLGTR
ncbi:MAG: orotate phosphoribosyltransferase [Chloroflexi bacterium]|nr:orotate phosphoribosyltransferase [Chloroflexota bacterium]